MESEEGFTLVEILMCVTLMSITAGVMTLSFHAADQTPKREAEKVAAYFVRLTQKSDRIKVCFHAKVNDNALNVFWNEDKSNIEPPFEISAGLKYTICNGDYQSRLKYDRNNFLKGAKIAVLRDITKYTQHKYISITSDNNNSPYYVLITDKDMVQ